jgi:hypothetical protein
MCRVIPEFNIQQIYVNFTCLCKGIIERHFVLAGKVGTGKVASVLEILQMVTGRFGLIHSWKIREKNELRC